MELFTKAELVRDQMTKNLNNYLEKNFEICSERCLTKFPVGKFTVNDERCMINCYNLRNHFWYETNLAITEFIKTPPTSLNSSLLSSVSK